MIVIDPSFELQDDLDTASLAVRLEACGRICYKSEDKTTDESAVPFVTKLAAHGHNSVLEMAAVTVRVTCSEEDKAAFYGLQPKYFIIDEQEGGILITGTIRCFREIYKRASDNGIVNAMVSLLARRDDFLYAGVYEDETATPVNQEIKVEKLSLKDVEQLSDELVMRHRYVGVKFIVNRAVTHELVRHRPCSFLQESQRYCRYSQDKFGNQVTFIKPMFFEEGSEEYKIWVDAMEYTEKLYLQLLETSTPQAARTVLPNSCKTEIIMYCNLEEWQHIIMLRTPPNAEPSMREIMIPFAEELKKRYPMM